MKRVTFGTVAGVSEWNVYAGGVVPTGSTSAVVHFRLTVFTDET